MVKERTQEIYAELRAMNLPAEAWALLAELTNINLWDARVLRAEIEERKAKDRERKRVSKENSTESTIILDSNTEGGMGETIPRKPIDALAPVLGADLGRAVVEHRQKLRAPLTLRAAEQLAKRLKTFPDPTLAAEKMLEKGWKSIERDWLKDPPNGKVLPFSVSPPKRSWAEIKAERERSQS